ncbi:ankyrin repeat ph and sec7 domain containing protein secg-related [Anaeramoeba ignava]|uniref:Ankyrin repeat ph and sec7 domain containing protein secg-related n=1 Tax=Anaeramoeba ignava TaxID=1746090 RepID=A0A9Q0LID2_ANAIG|nr:ankyrin repeat ph and sec7 domain containing protein secg-related [Anaeramoeba ignava]
MSYQVKTLKEHSEKPNISNNDQHWIFKCAAHLTKDGALTVIQNMIEKKSFKFSSKKNNTLLHYICKLPQTDEVLQFGLKHFDINSKNGETPLFYAIKKQIIPNVIFLLSKGADTSIKTNDTILHIAARTGNKELVKIVFEKNSSLTATNFVNFIFHLLFDLFNYLYYKNKKGYTPFDYACINSKSIDLVKMLYSEDILKDKKGFNLSYINTDSGSSTEIINFLISKNFDCKMKDGSTLLHSYCQKSRDLQMIKYLIELGLDVNEQNGNTPLHLLCQNNKEKDIFTYLINSGADVNLQNGNTPLHLCFWYSLPFEIIQVLLNAGADLSIENNVKIKIKI